MPAPAQGTMIDGFVSLAGGVNSGVIPLLVKKDEVSFAVNATMRGAFATNRPAFLNGVFDFGGDAIMENRFRTGRFQGAGIYRSDGNITSILVSISGRLYQIFPERPIRKVEEITITITSLIDQAFSVPAQGDSVTIVVTSTANLAPNYEIQIGGANYYVTQIIDGTTLLARNVDDIPGNTVQIGAILTFWNVNPSTLRQTWMFQAERWMIINDGQSPPIFFDGATSRRSILIGAKPELPTGRMGAYGWGRVWLALPDGKSYMAGDGVGGPSGTPEYKFRDSVLHAVENTYLKGGGSFRVPGDLGNITGMAFGSILDTSLGQGPLQVFTERAVFTVKTPVDRTEWAAVTDPIQTISLVSYGATSQWSISAVNGDLFYRAPDGWRSYIMGRREFNTWGNTPISREMNRVLKLDEQTLLPFASSCVFDNRLLMTVSPFFSQRGTYHRGMVVLDFDIISSMREKKPPVWDGLWTGLNVLQILSGTFDKEERCYAFVLTGEGLIELWEVTKGIEILQDADNVPVVWSIETGALFQDADKGGIFREKQLADGEIFVEDVRGRVDIQVFFKPDAISCWKEWHRWSVCAKDRSCQIDAIDGCVGMTELQPQSFPRMGLGIPPNDCDPVSNQQYFLGHTFQFKIQMQGRCRILGANFSAHPVPETAMAPIICERSECFVEVESSTGETFVNEAQTYVATCPDGETGEPVSVTIAAGAVSSTISVESANAIALVAAQQQAEASLICIP